MPKLALHEPLLLYACLSCASHLMCLSGDVGQQAEDYYDDEVFAHSVRASCKKLHGALNSAGLANNRFTRKGGNAADF